MKGVGCGTGVLLVAAGSSGNPVRVLHYLEGEAFLRRSGIETAVRHHRQALTQTDIDVVTSPWADGGVVSAVRSWLGGRELVPSVDIVHCHFIGPGTVAVVKAARRRGIPVVMHAHVTREDFAESFRGSTMLAPALGWYLRWLYSHADLVVCPSHYTKHVLESYPIATPIRVVSNGVDRERFTDIDSHREAYRARFGFEGPVVCSVGNVFERKGVSTLCRLAETMPYDFAWFGPYETGPLASPSVRRWIRDPPANMTFTGWIDDIRGAYAAGDICCFPTHTENQGIAVLEAMAAGKPVVLRDIPVFDEFYTDGEDCLKCTSLTDFQTAIERLATNSTLRERLGSNAQATAHSHGLDTIATALHEVYRTADRKRPDTDSVVAPG